MKSYIKTQNILGLLLVIGSIATNSTNNASQTPTNIEKEFDMLISCALLNPSGSWFRSGGWECGKYFLPLSRDKANFKRIIEATDFSEEGQRVASEFVKKHEFVKRPHGKKQVYITFYIQEKLPAYDDRQEEAYELAGALQDQIPGKKYYHNLFLDWAASDRNLDNLFNGTHIGWSRLPVVTDEQDQKNILQTIARHKRQTQS